jgi:hypothetical protein
MPNPTQSEPPVDALPTVRPADLTKSGYPNGRSSVGRRALVGLVRFLIIFCIGVSAALVWQSYGDPVREIVASSYPQLSWLAPQAEPVSQNAPDVIALTSRTASSPDQQQPNAISLDLDTVRQDIDRITTNIASSHEQMTGSANQIAGSTADSAQRRTDRHKSRADDAQRRADDAQPRPGHSRPGADGARDRETRTVHPFEDPRDFAAACLRLRAEARIAPCLRLQAQARIAGLAGTDPPLTLAPVLVYWGFRKGSACPSRTSLLRMALDSCVRL